MIKQKLNGYFDFAKRHCTFCKSKFGKFICELVILAIIVNIFALPTALVISGIFN